MGHRGVATFGSLHGFPNEKQSVCVHIRNSDSRNRRLSALKLAGNSEHQKSQGLILSHPQALGPADSRDLTSGAQALTLAELSSVLTPRSFTHLAAALYS